MSSLLKGILNNCYHITCMQTFTTPADLLAPVIDIVTTATAAAMKIYDASDLDVQFKADQSPVTAADLAVNDIIINGLRPLTPNIPIVSEELLIADRERRASSQIWLVDPIDGTKEFIKHN